MGSRGDIRQSDEGEGGVCVNFRYEILQLECIEENWKRFFVSTEHQRTLRLDPRDGVYKKMWEGETDGETAEDVLEKLYMTFNVDRPEGFEGHSLSVSDVIRLDGDDYYINPYGFECIRTREEKENGDNYKD